MFSNSLLHTAYNEKRSKFMSGRVLGGSSVLHSMLYLRGDQEIYNKWRDMGNPGWDYNNVLHYFKKAENNTNKGLTKSHFHGVNGPLTVSDLKFKSKLAKSFLDGGMELGYNVTDLNGANAEGFMTQQVTIRDGRRCSAAKAYLRPIRNRTNLHITMGSTAHRILIDRKTKIVQGVQFERNGKKYVAYARKEVILSAGTLNSPKILMLSGIGATEELNKFHIPVVHELPNVGKNLIDHVAFHKLIFTLNESDPSFNIDSYDYNDAISYAKDGNGKLTAANQIEGLALIKSKYAANNVSDILLTLSSYKSITEGGEGDINKQFYDQVFGPFTQANTFSIEATVVQPRSTGFVQLRSGNVYDAPIINPKYLSNEMDVKILIQGVRAAVRLAKTKAFRKYGTEFHNVVYPACKSIAEDIDLFWECTLRQLTSVFYHITSTCKMGPNSTDYVVDHRLTVHGIQGLRVIDASVMPTIPNANIYAATLMIAEKGADLIKEDFKVGKYI